MNKLLFIIVGVVFGIVISYLFEKKHIREFHTVNRKGKNKLSSNSTVSNLKSDITGSTTVGEVFSRLNR